MPADTIGPTEGSNPSLTAIYVKSLNLRDLQFRKSTNALGFQNCFPNKNAYNAHFCRFEVFFPTLRSVSTVVFDLALFSGGG
jgi:hypothetical protein